MNILERIKKLWTLSERNANTEEAASAAAKVQELCFKYNLELEAVLAQTGEKKEPYLKYDYLMPETTRFEVGWKRTLFSSVCRSNFCKSLYITGTARMTVIGQKQNFEVACYQYEYLAREIQRLAIEGAKAQGFFSNKDKRKYIMAFCEGASSAVCSTLYRSYETYSAETSDSKALVVVKDKELDAAVKGFYPRLYSGRARRINTGSGYSDGRTAGASITINPGVGSTSRGLIS